VRRAWVAVAAALALSACGAADDGSQPVTLTVFAAASLTEPFTEIGERFEASHPGVTVTFSFAGSSDLVAQLQQGAPADVLASADTRTMDTAVADDLVDGRPVDFASNTLQIVTPADNPARITSLSDLAEPGVALVLCAPAVPCGAATQQVEDAAGLDLDPVSEEQSVTDVLGKVRSGEADAGLVYVTDVRAAGDAVTGIAFDEAARAVNTYPVATLSGSRHAALARDFRDVVAGPEGRAVLADAGFAAP
jgi:molybdate transport system substrate-binding protein